MKSPMRLEHPGPPLSQSTSGPDPEADSTNLHRPPLFLATPAKEERGPVEELRLVIRLEEPGELAEGQVEVEVGEGFDLVRLSRTPSMSS